VEDLKKLPVRAIVALAVRCARRVEPLAQLPEGYPERDTRRAAVDAGLRLGEAFSRGEACPSADSVVQAVDASRAVIGTKRSCETAIAAATQVAHAAWLAWHARAERERKRHPGEGTKEEEERQHRLTDDAVDLITLSAFTAALEAYEAVGYDS